MLGMLAKVRNKVARQANVIRSYCGLGNPDGNVCRLMGISYPMLNSITILEDGQIG